MAKVYYICGACAEKAGGKWPEGHCATFHSSACDICDKLKGLAHVSDWQWPKGHKFYEENFNREF